jgi:hypothetical protein
LREIGVRSTQGYVFAPPLPGSQFLQLINAIDSFSVATAGPASHARVAQSCNRLSAV